MKLFSFGLVLLTGLANALETPTMAAGTVGITPELFEEFNYAAQLNLCSFVKTCKTPLGGKRVGVIAGSATGYIAVDDAKKNIIVVMRGSASVPDFVTDVETNQVPYNITGSENCAGCLIQHGVQKSVAGTVSYILSTVATAKAANPDYKIFVTGHSLGGATSHLVALALRSVYPAADMVIYALGSTRVGNPAFAAFLESQFPMTIPSSPTSSPFFRITHYQDGIPRLPARTSGYLHSGTEYWMSAETTTDGSQIKVCQGAEDPTCIQQFGVPKGNPINASHVKYIVSFLRPECIKTNTALSNGTITS